MSSSRCLYALVSSEVFWGGKVALSEGGNPNTSPSRTHSHTVGFIIGNVATALSKIFQSEQHEPSVSQAAVFEVVLHTVDRHGSVESHPSLSTHCSLTPEQHAGQR